MGKLDKLAKKAQELATQQLAKLQEQQQQQQQQKPPQQHLNAEPGQPAPQSNGAYAPPTIYPPGAEHPAYAQPPAAPYAPYAANAGAPPQQVQPTYAAGTSSPSPQYLPPTTYSPNPQGPQTGKKKALLIGCSYPGSRNALRGTLNDVMCMRHVLLTRFGFSEQQMLVLRDDVLQPGYVSDRATIIKAIAWLMTDLQPGDSLMFQFSGHGSQQRDPTGQEADGYDETILPSDFKRTGQIRDTELHQHLVTPLPSGVTLHALFDSCHSGTALDLPYVTQMDKTGAASWRVERGMRGSGGGTAVQIGACSDNQTAADTAKLSQTAYTGAATYCFIDAVEKYGPNQTYANLLAHMTSALKGLGKSSVNKPTASSTAMSVGLPLALGVALGPAGLLAGALMAPGGGRLSEQKPHLCCDKPLDLHNTQLMF